MVYRRRTFIPMFYHEEQIGSLEWKDGVMQTWTADGVLVGSYPTRHEAASALWAATVAQRREIRNRRSVGR